MTSGNWSRRRPLRWCLAAKLLVWSAVVGASSAPNATSTATATSTAIVEYILEGLGASSPTVSTLTIIANASITSPAANASSPAASASQPAANASSPAANTASNSGLAYAISCNSAYHAWGVASESFADANSYIVTTTVTTQNTCSEPTASRFITLCDGHPRVVGTASTVQTAFTHVATQTLQTQPPYSVPSPTCSISPSDCVLLYQALTVGGSIPHCSTGNLTVPATTPTPTTPPLLFPSTSSTLPNYNASTTCAPSQGVCFVYAANMRLAYWPVRTTSGSDNLCATNPSTVQAPITAAPQIAVYEGVTLTSPTIAMSLSNVGPGNCGTLIASTILLLSPDEVSSVEGARGEFTYYPFNFANLNYRCQALNNNNYTIQQTLGDDCYQEVPAEAYFNGTNNFESNPCHLSNTTQQIINNDYKPVVVLPKVFAPTITSLWGPYCVPYIDGVWDPPVAVTPVTEIAVLSTPSAPLASPTASPASAPSPIAEITQALPATTASVVGQSEGETPAPSQATSAAALIASILASPQSSNSPQEASAATAQGQSAASSQAASSSLSAAAIIASILDSPQTSNSGQDPSEASSVIDSDPKGSSNDPGSGAIPVATPASSVNVLTIGTNVFTQASSSNGVIALQNAQTSVTLSPSGNAVTVGAVAVSLDPSGQIIAGSEPSITTIAPGPVNAASTTGNNVFSVGTLPFTVAQGSGSVFTIQGGSDTLTAVAGGSGISLGQGIYITAASSGVVVQSGGATSTLSLGLASPTSAAPASAATIIVNSNTYTVSAAGSGSYEVIDATTTFALPVAGSATTIGSAVLSAASEGLVLQSSGSSSTLTLTPTTSPETIVLNSNTYTVSAAGSGSYEVIDATTTFALPVGGSATTIGSEVLSAGSEGLVLQSSGSSSTLTLTTTTSPETVIINSNTYTIIEEGTGLYELGDATTTLSLQVGSAATTLGSEVISAGSDGIVLQSGTSETTVKVTSNSNGAAGSTSSPGQTASPSAFGPTPIAPASSTTGSAASTPKSTSSAVVREVPCVMLFTMFLVLVSGFM